MGYQSEAQLEKNMINQLVRQGYEQIQLPDYDALLRNFRSQVNRFNQKKLEGKPLTDIEFNRLLNLVDGKSIFDSAKILRDKQIIEREDGSELYIELLNTREWCKNLFQVTTQTTVTGTYTNRYDVTILINGLPVVQVELKRRGLDFKEAFNQIQRYRKHSYKGLYRFLQIFVVTNGVDTKYFSNSDGDILFGYTFFWSDVENNIITNLNEFTASFLEKCHIAKMIARYMVLNDTEKLLMVMRPYQVYATEALVQRALETKNSGFIWHTTGSGKTLTSFKASQILANEPSIKKVFFLVDRKDLDSQTIAEFNKFEKGSVDRTEKTDLLVKQIEDVMKPFIVTTIQKMANAVKNPRFAHIMDQYKGERVIFIIDECHRSQFGEMHTNISRHFENAQHFGFTGTPRFEENKSQDGRTTADLFEKCLHTYLIKEAIRDGNVLGFSVEHIRTFNVSVDESDDTRVEAINTDEVWMHDKRMQLVVNNILDNHERKSRSKGYTAIFTVQSIPMLIKYYEMFKQIEHPFKIAGIFSYGANEESEGKDEHSRDSLERIITDYNGIFDTNFTTDTYASYFSDISKRVKTAQIDILLVVNMFLTGFDSRTLNTLYVDKNLKHHDLLQAFSRTNRVEKATKPYGNVVCYRNLKDNTDEALKLFSQTDSVDDILMKSYVEYLAMFLASLKKVREIAATPEAVDELEREEDQKAFVNAFKDMTKLLVRLKTFTEFEFDPEILEIESQTYEDYKSKYFKIAEQVKKDVEKVSILQDIDFELELMHTDRINVSYIMNLMRDLDFDNKEDLENKLRFIEEEVGRADNPELRLKVDLIKGFLKRVVPDLTNEDSVDDAYNSYEEEMREKEIHSFSEKMGMPEEDLKQYLEEYEYSNIIQQSVISDSLKVGLIKKRKLARQITEFIMEHTERYT
ncbi:type I restriction endonuclease subunit R [Sporosarcina beigongshangi]|uniref:type I restriction endonuclease subunit R n=1 Tax=Sporosarcina beigongshangi TaxID=2782538 RepID=UPI0019397763|nr:type I restriction endonuclease subunit R [Sporosarcina beigongshangi]